MNQEKKNQKQFKKDCICDIDNILGKPQAPPSAKFRCIHLQKNTVFFGV